MTLFDATDLFASETAGRKTFDVPDADLLLGDNFFTKEESDHYYNILLGTTKWREYEMPMYDKTVTAPRMVAWYGDANSPERRSDPDWPNELPTIKKRIENETQLPFDAVLLHL